MKFLGKQQRILQLAVGVVLFAALYLLWTQQSQARNISTYRDTISDSTPGDFSDHTFNFTILTNVAPGGYLSLVPGPDFSINSSSSFQERNVELLVNGVPRAASSTGNAVTDQIAITYGSPGEIRYTLNPTTGINEGSVLTFKVGANTSGAFNGETIFSSSTGTTTLPQDVGILNASTVGTHRMSLNIIGGDAPAYTNFLIALVDEVGVGPVDTREEIPPFRFNGRPEGNVGGTTLSVELSLETDEFAICRYSQTPGVDFNAMVNTFSSTGLIVHRQVIAGLANDTDYTFYVRCIDDEDNFNIDDYPISFRILDVPDGEPNEDGDVEGDGTGSGNDGGGGGSGGGGVSGGTEGGSPTTGASSGGGGSGGGGGGGTGPSSGGTAGGGFNTDAPFRSGDGRVVINGFAFPRSVVTILVDGQIAATTQTAANGSFTVTIEDIARGVYTFGVYATDANNVKSSTFSTSFSVQGARTSSLSNINIMPSIRVAPDPVDIGGTVTFNGYAIPNAVITLENLKDGTNQSLRTLTTTSDANGVWSLQLSTNGFTQGTYKVRAKAVQTGGVETNFSNYTLYGVGQAADRQINADLNRDGKVNLIDFSILLFWWGRDGGTSDPPADINGDGTVSLTDFSILLFNWTG